MNRNASTIPRDRMKVLWKVERSLGFKFSDRAMLDRALTHPSFAHETHPGSVENIDHYEQLEFIGDAVLGLVVGHLLFEENPGESEGYLTRARADMVNKFTLAEIAGKLELGQALKLGKGERLAKGWEKPSIQAAAFEAVVGAMYLDSGYKKTYKVIEKLFGSWLKEQMTGLKDPRSMLQEWAQKKYHQVPTYTLLNAEGPGHKRTFKVEVIVGDRRLAVAEGSSKKEAYAQAARKALEKIEL